MYYYAIQLHYIAYDNSFIVIWEPKHTGQWISSTGTANARRAEESLCSGWTMGAGEARGVREKEAAHFGGITGIGGGSQGLAKAEATTYGASDATSHPGHCRTPASG